MICKEGLPYKCLILYLSSQLEYSEELLLFCLVAAHFLGAHVLVEGEEAVEENQESHQ